MRSLIRLLAVFLLAGPVALSSQSAGSIPAPVSVLGFEPGADFKEATYDQVVSYFQKVDAASDRVTMMQAGRTSQGRPFHFALISSKENLSKIDRYREIARRLAHPEGLTDDEARRLAREGKVFVHVDGGLHATEIAGPQSTPLILYNLLTRKDPTTDAIFDNVIFMLWPTINPDGMQMVTEWFMSHVDPANPRAPVPGLPQLYQEYVGHDNNRDAYMLNMIESRVMEHTWRAWEPNLIYVLHQAPPPPARIWLPPFAEPIATHAPPIPSAQLNMIGMAIAQGLSERRMPGAVHMLSTYDAWYPGYIDYAGVFKNVPSFWTETAGASPIPGNVNVTEPQRLPKALYVDPYPGGEWRLRNAVEYDEAAVMSVLEYAAKYRESLLYGRYQSGRDQISRGRAEAPYAYVIPATPSDQRDPVAAVELLRRLAFSGVRVYRLKELADIGLQIHAAGTWVIPADQEFAALAREVLDVQKYPVVIGSDGDPDPPYDAAGWTLPMQMGVTVTAISKPLTRETRAKMELIGPMPDPKLKPAPYNMTPAADAATFDSVPGIGFDSNPSAAGIVPPAGTIAGTGQSLALSPAQNNTFKALNRVWKAGLDVQFMTIEPGGGRYVVNGLSEKDQDDLVKMFALSAERVNASAEPIKKPRIGLLSAPNSMDEGWTRWVLDMYGFEYLRITADEIQAGSLRNKIDVLLIANESSVAGGRGGGRGGGAGRGGAAPTPAPAGAETVDPRIRAVDEFVKAGGTLVCFGNASTSAIDTLKLPVKNAVSGLRRTEFSAGGGGSVLQVTTDPSHRVMSGMPEKAAVFYSDTPAFDTLPDFHGTVLARYADSGSPLLSGYLIGEKYLQGKAAALDVELGSGHVILLGFRPQWRGQPFGTFRIIFNALLYTR
jgi:hypothetical protein